MPEYTEYERTRLHAMARQQIRFVSLAPTLEAASNRRFLALGYLLALTEAGAWSSEIAESLQGELRVTTSLHIDELFQQTLRETLAPDGVHCTGHVDYDPASRKPGDAP